MPMEKSEVSSSTHLDTPWRHIDNQLKGDGKSSCFSNGCRKEDRCAYRRKRQSGYAWISRKWYNLRQPIGESPDAGGSNAEKGHGTDAAYPASYRHMPTKNDGCLPYNGQRDSLSRYKSNPLPGSIGHDGKGMPGNHCQQCQQRKADSTYRKA